jgi:hypothetical protein
MQQKHWWWPARAWGVGDGRVSLNWQVEDVGWISACGQRQPESRRAFQIDEASSHHHTGLHRRQLILPWLDVMQR